jgi:hypothetical protein
MIYLISLDDSLFPKFDGTQQDVMALIGASIVGQILEWGQDDAAKDPGATPWLFADDLRVLDAFEGEGKVKLLAWMAGDDYYTSPMTYRQAQVLEHISKGMQQAVEKGKDALDPFALE